MNLFFVFIAFVFIDLTSLIGVENSIYPVYDIKEMRFRGGGSSSVDKGINHEGLDQLRASGSSQFSEKILSDIEALILQESQEFVIIDLREESHCFINGLAVSWSDQMNEANRGKTLSEIERDEYERLEEVIARGEIEVLRGGQLESIDVYTAQTERELVEGRGIRYIRLPVTDHDRPSDAIIEQFIDIISCLPSESWVHFHCRGGKGRTTTFLVFYDIIRNAEKVSLEHIITRQYAIGGSDLQVMEKDRDAKSRQAKKRLGLIQEFYTYCKQNPNFEIRWSERVSEYLNFL